MIRVRCPSVAAHGTQVLTRQAATALAVGKGRYRWTLTTHFGRDFMIQCALVAGFVFIAAPSAFALSDCDAEKAHRRLESALSLAKKGRSYDACALFSLGKLDVQIYCQSCQAAKLEACMQIVSETERAMTDVRVRCAADGRPIE